MGAESLAIDRPDGPMSVYLALPEGDGPYPLVVVYMEAFGLVGSIKTIADRLAANGYAAAIPDLFYFIGPDNTAPYDDIPKGMAMMAELSSRGPAYIEDVSAMLRDLEGRTDVITDRVGGMGFCMGGTLAFGAACGLGDRIAASACYYGGRIQTLLPMAAGIKGPVRIFYGGLDTFIPPGEVEAVRSGLAALDLDAEVVLYPDADHGFCNEARAEVYDGDAADDSWARTLEMFGRALAA